MIGLVAVIVAARLWLVFHRLYDPDELQHLHAGYCVWNGMVPYRDFFEQHGPVLWYLSVPLFRIWGDSLDVLTAGRALIWIVNIFTMALTWWIGRQLYGRWAAATSVLLLVTLPAFQEKSVEWRPDNIAVPLVLLSLLACSRSYRTRGWIWSGLAGAAIAAAFVCTQKVAYVGVGLVAGHLWTVFREFGLSGWKWFASFTTGAVLVAGAVLIFFATQSSHVELVRMTLLLPLEWKTREPRLPLLLIMLASAPVFWSAFVGGIILAFADLRQASGRQAGTHELLCGAIAHVAGLLMVPAAFLQYYLPLIPLAALLSARALIGLAGRIRGGIVEDLTSRRTNLNALQVAVLVACVILVMRVGVTRSFLNQSSTWLLAGGLAAAVVGLVRSVARAGWSWRGPQVQVAARWPVLVALMAGLAGAFPFLWLHFRWKPIHDQQERQIVQLISATSPDDRFFDGFTGFGALRPHAFFHYWINHHSWPMIPEREKSDSVMRALSDPTTRVVLFDKNLRLLPDAAKQYIDANFQADPRYSDATCVVFVRRGAELPEP
jgi:4-amino-4-deoxy-L-arabinose transferase-like glycosyltransferase